MGDTPARRAVDDALGHLADAGQTGHHHRVGRQCAARGVHVGVITQPEGLSDDQLLRAERRVQLGDVERPCRPRLGTGRAGGLRDREVTQTEGHRFDPVVDPADPCGPGAQLSGSVVGREDHGTGAVGDRRAVALAQRVHDRLHREEVLLRDVPRQLRVGVVHGVAPAACRHLAEVRLPRLAPVDQRSGLEGGEADRVGPERGDVVRVELAREDLVDRSGSRLPVAVDEGGVDVPELELHPGLVQRPGPVHLDVALLDRRPGPDPVEGRHEAERLPGEVVRGAGAGEADLLLVEPGALAHVLDDRHEHLDLVADGLLPHVGHLREGDDGDVPHQVTPSPGWRHGARRVRRWDGSTGCSRGWARRSASSTHTASTRMPMRTSSTGHSWMRCIKARSAPSRRISPDV